MLIPSIDLMGGRIVQLVHGETLKLAFDDFSYWIRRFESYPLVQLIDLNAAMRQGDNAALVEEIAARLPCQVGGGIHTVEKALAVLAAGARRVIIGSALFSGPSAEEPLRQSESESESGGPTNPDAAAAGPAYRAASAASAASVNLDFARALAEAAGAERLVFSVDTKAGRVAVKGWKDRVEITPDQAIRKLEPFCHSFLYTHIDKEGTMQGFPFEIARRLRTVTSRKLIVAGGIREQSEIDALDAIGVDAVAGMAVYSGILAT